MSLAELSAPPALSPPAAVSERAPRGGLIWGLALCAVGAGAARLLHAAPFPPFEVSGQHPVDALALAIVIGLTLGEGVRRWRPGVFERVFAPGARLAAQRLLPVAIGLMGLKLDFGRVLALSADSLLVSVLCVGLALWATERICLRFGVQRRLGRLIAIGAGICGGTAVAVTAPALGARDEEATLAMSLVTLYGLVCVAILPPVGALLDMSQHTFGVWSGVTVHATAQVLATAHTYGPEAGEVALVVKLARVLLLAPVLLWATWSARRWAAEAGDDAAPGCGRRWRPTDLVPPFIIGFLALAIANSLGLVPSPDAMAELGLTLDLRGAASWASMALMTCAMVGVGACTSLSKLRALGPRPLLAGAVATVLMASFSGTLIGLGL